MGSDTRSMIGLISNPEGQEPICLCQTVAHFLLQSGSDLAPLSTATNSFFSPPIYLSAHVIIINFQAAIHVRTPKGKIPYLPSFVICFLTSYFGYTLVILLFRHTLSLSNAILSYSNNTRPDPSAFAIAGIHLNARRPVMSLWRAPH